MLARQAGAAEPRKLQRPPALQLPSEADGPLAVLLSRLDDSGSAQHSSGAQSSGAGPATGSSGAHIFQGFTSGLGLNNLAQAHSALDGCPADTRGMRSVINELGWERWHAGAVLREARIEVRDRSLSRSPFKYYRKGAASSWRAGGARVILWNEASVRAGLLCSYILYRSHPPLM